MPAVGATAGAMLIPMVTKAHMIAAKAERMWLREEVFIFMSFIGRRS